MIYRIPDTDGPAYDQFIKDDRNRSEKEAEKLIDEAIKKTVASKPNSYDWDDVLNLLKPQGFSYVSMKTLTTVVF